MLEQACPSCRTTKYTNPQMRLMVNVCGHLLCENCVEVLFVRGSGLCVECRIPIRRSNFRFLLFDDPFVQKEVELRKRILSDFNKQEDDFDSMEEYDLYLEKIEEIIYNLMHNIDLEETRRYVESYKKENKDSIKRNRSKPSSSMQFYNNNLENEAEVRRQSSLSTALPSSLASAAGDNSSCDLQSSNTAPPSAPSTANSTTSLNAPATASFNVPASSYRFPPAPPSFTLSGPPTAFSQQISSYLPPPPSTAISHCPSTGQPPSTFVLNRSVSGGRLPAHNSVGGVPRQQDTVFIPPPQRSQRANSSSANRNNLSKGTSDGEPFHYVPYEIHLWGPLPPLPNNDKHHQDSRWSQLVSIYEQRLVESCPQTNQQLDADDVEMKPSSYDDQIKADPDGDLHNTVQPPSVKADPENDDSLLKQQPKPEQEEDVKPSRRSLADLMPRGASGIGPETFLERCLMESRCALLL